MPGTQDQDTVKPLSYTPIDKDGKVTPETPPTPTPRTSTPKKNDEGINPPSPEEAGKTISDILNIAPPILPKAPGLQDKEDENLFDLSTEVSPPSLEETKGEETHVDVPQNSTLIPTLIVGQSNRRHCRVV
ncbi:uncharacterized protein TNCT_526291 [Trichonephila clavata]|uniref:Uncharacterized protein n=1 Tax=Trichonephila clavata TaxID=2740835 RepID=A0A8X6J4W4_TRICU|nr:uncharacterized protein TNCT_526291 [Trichonephila clavata]